MQEEGWTFGPIVVAVDDPKDTDVVLAAMNLGEELGTTISVIRKDNLAEAPSQSITIWTSDPDQPAMRQFASRVSSRLGIQVDVRRREEEE